MQASKNIATTLDPCIVLMKELVGQFQDEWKQDEHGILSLAQGVVYWDPPEDCTKALKEEDIDSWHKYGPADGSKELVTALKTKIQNENNLLDHRIMVTAGANQAYMNCILSLCDSGKKHVVFTPYYFNHVMALQMVCGADSVLYGPCDANGIPDMEWLRTQFELSDSNIQTVTVVHPANPTGVAVPSKVLETAGDLCEENGAWFLLDATYEYFVAGNDNDHEPSSWIDTSATRSPSSLYFTNPPPPHLIVIGSFSKSYALAGYRCGYVCLSDEELWNQMLKVQDTVLICPPAVTQAVATGALRAGSGWVLEKFKTLEASRTAILEALHPLHTIGGDGAMYVMAELRELDGDGTEVLDDVSFCRRLVREHGLAIIPGTYCGRPGWVRVCYANLKPEITVDVAAVRLKEGVQSILGQKSSTVASS